MNTTQLIDHVAAVTDLSKKDAKAVYDAIIAAIVEVAATGDETALTGFGKFSVRPVAARKGRNPATGEVIDIPASRKFAFTPAKAVKDALQPPAPVSKTPKKKSLSSGP